MSVKGSCHLLFWGISMAIIMEIFTVHPLWLIPALLISVILAMITSGEYWTIREQVKKEEMDKYLKEIEGLK